MREPRTNHYISGVLVDKRRLTNAKFLPRVDFKFHTTIAFIHSSESTPYPRSAYLFEIPMEQPLHPRILTHLAEEPLTNVFSGSSCPGYVPSSRPCATRSGYLFRQHSRRGLEPMDRRCLRPRKDRRRKYHNKKVIENCVVSCTDIKYGH
uniref:(northern house mosquito) hypothetical protein n=1 Tax=Culex pipiens TaxID=7175 RepID=A0A8D8GWY9_CULPI